MSDRLDAEYYQPKFDDLENHLNQKSSKSLHILCQVEQLQNLVEMITQM